MTARVLVVDDEANIRRMLAALLEQEGHEVLQAAGAAEGVRACEAFDPDVVLLDLVMDPGPSGLELLEDLKRRRGDLTVIMMSGKATLADAVRATKLGAFQFLEKPLTPEGVLVTVKAGLELARARAQARALEAEAGASGRIVGSSNAIEQVRRLIAQVAPTGSRVLITGESGTGKELVARAIHEASPRRHGPLVCLNCAAVPRDLVESELFGHEKGAFTGATQRRRGKFELADGGTLFLDEVGDLETGAQAKLLRALETGTFARVGAEREVKVDVRVIAATNRDLERGARDGQFRADLFYRLNVFALRVPPLRERSEDIPSLVAHFARAAAASCACPVRTFTPEAIERLQAHHWPGNIRELANLVERLTIVGGEGAVSAAEAASVLGAVPPRHGEGRPRRAGLVSQLEAYETELIRSALADAAGNVAEAARRLSTDRANLYRRMRRLGVHHKDTGVSD